MSQAIDSIESHILDTRRDLGENLQALETKVRFITDWHHYLRTKPLLMLGCVVGGVVLFTKSMGRRRNRKGW